MSFAVLHQVLHYSIANKLSSQQKVCWAYYN